VFATIAVLAVAWACPANAQRHCSPPAITNAAGGKVTPASATAVKAEVYAPQAPLAAVSGGGTALLTDPDGEKFTHQFSIGAVVNSDGSAQGHANFVFPMPFSLKWGALPGVSEIIHLQGEITAGAVSPGGEITLTGPFIETDYASSEGILFREDSRVSGASPLRIVTLGPPGSKTFTLAWCNFIPPGGAGSFSIEVTSGNLKVQ